MSPAILANLSCRLNVGASARLDGRGKNSTVCIRFLHLRDQKSIQGQTASSEFQKGCLQLALEIQTICWPEARKFETSDLEIVLFMGKGGRMEDHILLRSRTSTSQEMDEDTLLGILMSFMLGNSVPRGPGVDLHWCPLTHRIGTTSCALTGVTVRRSLFNLTRREVCFDHQRRGQVEWSLNNKKDPTLRRMIKVLTKTTSGSDLLSFLKDRNWGTPADRRRKPRWDLLRSHQHEAYARGLERSEITVQSQGGGQDPWAQEKTEQDIGEAGARLQVHDMFTEGTETEMSGGGEHTADAETTNTTSSLQEMEGTLSTEENPVVSSSSEEETDVIDESEDQFEGEGFSEALPSLSPLTKGEQGHPRRRGRTRQWAKGADRVQETKTLLTSRTFCSEVKIQRNIQSLLHLGTSGRDEELSLTTFEKCTDPRGCGTQRGPSGTAERCKGCTVRLRGRGSSRV
jgi:hypothetical protein